MGPEVSNAGRTVSFKTPAQVSFGSNFVRKYLSIQVNSSVEVFWENQFITEAKAEVSPRPCPKVSHLTRR